MIKYDTELPIEVICDYLKGDKEYKNEKCPE